MRLIYICALAVAMVAGRSRGRQDEDFRLSLDGAFIAEGILSLPDQEQQVHFQEHTLDGAGLLYVADGLRERTLYFELDSSEGLLYEKDTKKCRPVPLEDEALKREMGMPIGLYRRGQQLHVGPVALALKLMAELVLLEDQVHEPVRGLRTSVKLAHLRDGRQLRLHVREHLNQGGQTRLPVQVELLDGGRSVFSFQLVDTFDRLRSMSALEKRIIHSDFWRLPLPCVRYSRSPLNGSHLGEFRRFRASFEAILVSLNLDSTRHQVQMDLDQQVWSHLDLEEQTWTYADVGAEFFYERNLRTAGGDCRLHLEHASEFDFLKDLGQLRVFRFAGLDESRGHRCQAYERLYEDPADKQVKYTRVCMRQVPSRPDAFEPIYYEHQIFLHGWALEPEFHLRVHFFEFEALDVNDRRFRTEFDLADCLNPASSVAPMSVQLLYGQICASIRQLTKGNHLNTDEMMLKDERPAFVERNRLQIERALVEMLRQKVGLPSHWVQDVQLVPSLRSITASFDVLRLVGPEVLFERESGFDLDTYLTSASNRISFEHCAGLVLCDSLPSNFRLARDGGCQPLNDTQFDAELEATERSADFLYMRRRPTKVASLRDLYDLRMDIYKLVSKYKPVLPVDGYELRLQDTRSRAPPRVEAATGFELVAGRADLRPEQVRFELTDGEPGVHMQSSQQCFQRCRQRSPGFRCLGFSLCRSATGAARCRLTDTLPGNRTQPDRLTPSDRCSVYAVSPLAQFRRYAGQQIQSTDARLQLGSDRLATEAECAGRCLALADCRTFAVLPADGDGRLPCDFFAVHIHAVSFLRSEPTNKRPNPNSTVYSVDQLQDFREVPFRLLRKVLSYHGPLSRFSSGSADGCALACAERADCTAINFCHRSTIGGNLPEASGDCDLEVNDEGAEDKEDNYKGQDCITFERQAQHASLSGLAPAAQQPPDSVYVSPTSSTLVLMAMATLGLALGAVLLPKLKSSRQTHRLPVGAQIAFRPAADRQLLIA